MFISCLLISFVGLRLTKVLKFERGLQKISQPSLRVTLIVPKHTRLIFQVGNTPLHLACQANEVDTVEVLIEKGADLNCLNQVKFRQNSSFLVDPQFFIFFM